MRVLANLDGKQEEYTLIQAYDHDSVILGLEQPGGKKAGITLTTGQALDLGRFLLSTVRSTTAEEHP